MEEGRASATAERVAERRAAHQILDSPRIFDDPLALRIIRPQSADAIRRDPQLFNRSPMSRYLRLFLAIRSRFAEDVLRDAVARGVNQYVLLGAGFDTFGYRNPYAALRVFEIDHPATQAVKRERLDAAGIAIPPLLSFAPADLSTRSAVDALADTGFDLTRPAVVAWLGVVPYLELVAVTSTLRDIAKLRAGSQIVLDYGIPPSSMPWLARLAVRGLERRVAAAGEPFKSFFEPDEMRALLGSCGFEPIEDFTLDDLLARYLGADAPRLGTRSGAHIVAATVRS